MPTDNKDPSLGDTVGSVPREELYTLVWTDPMVKVAARFGVSSSYLARICTLLDVPRPARGYWAQLAVGRAGPQPTLPPLAPGHLTAWVRDGRPLPTARPVPPPRRRRRPVPLPPRASRTVGPIEDSATTTPQLHPLLIGARGLFEAGRPYAYSDVPHLRPSKRLLVDLVVTRAALDKALDVANTLFRTLDAQGYRVMLAPVGETFARAEIDPRESPGRTPSHDRRWHPARITVTYIGTVPIGLTLIEMTERVPARFVKREYIRVRDLPPPVAGRRGRYDMESTWTTPRDFATGRLMLQAYSPYWRAQWTRLWHEAGDRDLTTQASQIVKALEAAAPVIAELFEQGEREAELERQRWEEAHTRLLREHDAQRRAEARSASLADLRTRIAAWSEAERARAFFDAADQRVASLSETERVEAGDRLARARELLGPLDPLQRLAEWKAPEEP